MPDRHRSSGENIAEVLGDLVHRAYARAVQVDDEGDMEAIPTFFLLVEQMARGLRITMSLEAKLARDHLRQTCAVREMVVSDAETGQVERLDRYVRDRVHTLIERDYESERGSECLEDLDRFLKSRPVSLYAPVGEQIADLVRKLKAQFEAQGALPQAPRRDAAPVVPLRAAPKPGASEWPGQRWKPGEPAPRAPP